MLFNSINFAFYLLTVVSIYAIIPSKIRAIWLLISSYYFYSCCNKTYVIILLIVTLTTYFGGLKIQKTDNIKYKKMYFIFIILIILSLLTYFKYINFILTTFNESIKFIGIESKFEVINLLLPIGISFYTFVAIGYLIDVIRGKIKAEKNIIIYSLFVSFFPAILSGPIERSYHLIPQLKLMKRPEYEKVREGFILLLWGLFCKIVIADRLALVVNSIFNDIYSYSGVSYIIASLFFTFQIYLDFAGYTYMAMGIAKFFNIDLINNFNKPYISKTVTEFWGRWHISLSTWFRDYLYIPLGGNRVPKIRWALNTLIVFVVSGIWHGAAYTFLIWGTIHGVILIVEKLIYGSKIKNVRNENTIIKFLQTLLTFSIVSIAWVFFRAKTVSDAIHIISNYFNFKVFSLSTLFQNGGVLKSFGCTLFDFVISIVFLLLFILIQLITSKNDNGEYIAYNIKQLPTFLRWTIYVSISIMILWFGKFGMNKFLYSKF